jgi:hypothetical protein
MTRTILSLGMSTASMPLSEGNRASGSGDNTPRRLEK